MKTTKLALALTTTLLAAGNASAASFNDFTVAESSVEGFAIPNYVADKITGNYVEVATFGAGTFDLSLKWNAGQFVANDGSTPIVTSALNTPAFISPAGYGLYGLYEASGTFTSAGGVTVFTFLTGNVDLYIDKNLDTTFTQPAAGTIAWATANDADDYKIATGGDTSVSGQGTLDTTLPTCVGGGINCGSFGVSHNFKLVAGVGDKYFVLPKPFYNVAFESGQLNNFDVSGTQVINGSFDLVFNKVPEPGILALMGLGMLGLGFNNRKQSM